MYVNMWVLSRNVRQIVCGALLCGSWVTQAAAMDEASAPEVDAAPAVGVMAEPISQVAVNKVANPNDAEVAQWQQRLLPFLAEQDSQAYYFAKKAALWLSYAANEGSERSLTTARQESLQQAKKIIEALENEQTDQLSMTTPILSVSSVMRRDLWVNAELLKQHGGFSCAQGNIAQAEVMLVWAAAEHCELGWRHSRELFSAAERLIDQANYEAFNCKAGLPTELPQVGYPSFESLNGKRAGCHGVVGAWPIVAPPSPVEVPVPVIEEVPALVVPNVVHFALDQSYLSAMSEHVLDKVAKVLVEHPEYSITLLGYTDLRASVAYNLALSQRRAQSVANYLEKKGVDARRIAMQAEGESNTISDPKVILGHGLSRRVEIEFSAADGQTLTVVPQREDLQLEK